MWLYDPYEIDQVLLRHAEDRARVERLNLVRNRSRLSERAALALRVLLDAGLAERMRESVARPAAAAAPRVPVSRA